jgi:ribulose-5-phosphate 4-epimerase/fuculose-1-phosphate aldolase
MNEQLRVQNPSVWSDSEWKLRCELAACYRIFHELGWTELIFNHITLELPGEEQHFLINPYGLTYDEVTASNLVKIDLDGHAVDGSGHDVNPAGFLIHSVIHRARPDAKCIAHTHTTAGCAVAALSRGLECTNFYAAQLHNEVAYHDFEGITVDQNEGPRLLASLGDKSGMILRNHGLLACGRSIPEAFYLLWRLERACQIQIATHSYGSPTIEIPAAVAERSTRQLKTFDPRGDGARRIFDALRRKIDPQLYEI